MNIINGSVNPEIVKNMISRCNFVIITVMYEKVYICLNIAKKFQKVIFWQKIMFLPFLVKIFKK